MHAGAISSRSSAVARVAEVLNRRRALTIDMIRRLHEGLGLSADVLIRPCDLRGRRSAASAFVDFMTVPRSHPARRAARPVK
jgi:plasmid maintenance system antidote protein VapI